jgi:hypothetical protein
MKRILIKQFYRIFLSKGMKDLSHVVLARINHEKCSQFQKKNHKMSMLTTTEQLGLKNF